MCALMLAALLLADSPCAYAQVEKGSKETIFSGGFFVGLDESSGNGGGSVSGKFGYFLTRHHEIGGGTSISVFRFRFCSRTIDANGNVISESCDSDVSFGMGLSGFYRYNFAKEGAKGFPFVGGAISVASVTDNFTGNFSARPEVGYKYFLKKNVALDFSVGVTLQLNKVGDDFFLNSRRENINGQLGLSFIF